MSSTFLGLCKCIPQVRQVVYQAGCAVLKLRVSDTGMQQGEEEEGEEEGSNIQTDTTTELMQSSLSF